MTDGTDESTHTPLYIGTRPEEADCRVTGRWFASTSRQSSPTDASARPGMALRSMRAECCIDLFAIAGEPNIDSDRAIRHLWKQYVENDWATLEALFVTGRRGSELAGEV